MESSFIYFQSALLLAWTSCEALGLLPMHRLAFVSDLQVVNWDLSLLQLQWKYNTFSDNPNVTFEVALVGQPKDEILTTKQRNLTWRGPACLVKTLEVRPKVDGHSAGTPKTMDLRDVFYGDEMHVQDVEVDYSEFEVLVGWRRSRSVCVDAYDVSYKGKNISSSRNRMSVPNRHFTYRVREKPSDLSVIEIRPLHAGYTVDEYAVETINVTEHNDRTSCQGRRPGAIKYFDWRNFYVSVIHHQITAHWEICHHNTSPRLVEETTYEISTVPENHKNVAYRKRQNDLSQELVILNVEDVCKINAIKIDAIRDKETLHTYIFYVSSWMFTDWRVHDFRVSRITSNLITLRWQRVNRRNYFNCSEAYEVTFNRVPLEPLIFVTTGVNFTYNGDTLTLHTASVQLMRGGFRHGTPTRVVVPIPSMNDLDALRVASVMKDSIRFEWPKLKTHSLRSSGLGAGSQGTPDEYRVRLARGDETLEFMTSDLDLEWEGDPCLLRDVTVQAIQAGHDVGPLSHLNLTAYFYEDAHDLDLLNEGRSRTSVLSVPIYQGRHCVTGYVIKAEPGGHVKEGSGLRAHIERLNISPCEIKSASVQPLHRNEPVGWKNYYNLTRLGRGTIPKLNVSVIQYGLQLFVSWSPEYDNYTMCPQDVRVKINVTSSKDSHIKEAIGAEVDEVFTQIVGGSENDTIHFDKLVPCRPYTMTVTTPDGNVHYKETRTILPKDDDLEVTLKSKKSDDTSVLLELGWEVQGDCLPKIGVDCHPPLPQNNLTLNLTGPGSGFVKIYELASGKHFNCYMTEDEAVTSFFWFETDAKGEDSPEESIEAMVDRILLGSNVQSVGDLLTSAANASLEGGEFLEIKNALADAIEQKAEEEAEEMFEISMPSSQTIVAESTPNFKTHSGDSVWLLLLLAGLFIVIGVTLVFHKNVLVVVTNTLSYGQSKMENLKGRIMNSRTKVKGVTNMPNYYSSQRILDDEEY